MRIVAWNVAHQARAKAIPDRFAAVFTALEADLVLLNEFVDAPTRAPFYESLEGAGFEHRAVLPTPGPQNQVLAASRLPFTLGDLKPPEFDEHSVSNFLHLAFDQAAIEVVGFRAPAYKTAAERRTYWASLLKVMAGAARRPILFAGDFNRNPFDEAHQPNALSVPVVGCDLLRVPNPVGPWSFMFPSGGGQARIDHVAHTAAVDIRDAVYVTAVGGCVLAGLKAAAPISDHAALVFTASRHHNA